METIPNNVEIKRQLGTVTKKGEETGSRPNPFLPRVGKQREYLNIGKSFTLSESEEKKGDHIPPGHSMGLTSFEYLHFTRETVRKIYPSHDVHAMITPIMNLLKGGIVSPVTQVDAGWMGTLN